MSNQTVYEFDWELMSKDGDIEDVWDDDGYNEYRTWAYLTENNELDEFDDGSKVPQFVQKFFKFATY